MRCVCFILAVKVAGERKAVLIENADGGLEDAGEDQEANGLRKVTEKTGYLLKR